MGLRTDAAHSWHAPRVLCNHHRAVQSLVLALSILFVLVSPVLAIESHVVNVKMTLSEPVVLSATSLELAEGAAGEVAVALSPAFLDQARCTGLSYRIVAEIEPPVGRDPSGPMPSVVLERAGTESDADEDSSDAAALSVQPADTTDLWSITLLSPSAGLGESVPFSAMPSIETTAAAVPLTMREAPPVAGVSGDASVWRVHVSAEVIGYRTPEGVVE